MSHTNLVHTFRLLFILLLVFVGCEATQRAQENSVSYTPADLPTVQDDEPRQYIGLEQVVAYHKNVFSGGRPQGQEGLHTLQQLGFRTIICVDGAAPQVEAAAALGMRYIHLPIKYDAPDTTRIVELVVATELGIHDGLTYVHCHHGKHRSATAVALALIGLGVTDTNAMVARMKVSATSKIYKGLWDAVTKAIFIDIDQRKAIDKNLPSSVQPTGIVESMLAAESAVANLKLFKSASWNVPANHPDLVLAAEAGTLSELFRHLRNDVSIKKYPKTFHAYLQQCWSASQRVENAIVRGNYNSDELAAALSDVTRSCTRCHLTFRK